MDAGDALRRVGAALYGDDWLPRLRAELDVSDRTLRRWIAGQDPVPAGVWGELLRLAIARHQELGAILPTLPGATQPDGTIDPIEAIVAGALDTAAIPYIRGDNAGAKLDFYLPAWDLHIETKAYHSPRIAEQMARGDNVIAIQGRGAAQAFALMLQGAARRG